VQVAILSGKKCSDLQRQLSALQCEVMQRFPFLPINYFFHQDLATGNVVVDSKVDSYKWWKTWSRRQVVSFHAPPWQTTHLNYHDDKSLQEFYLVMITSPCKQTSLHCLVKRENKEREAQKPASFSTQEMNSMSPNFHTHIF